MSFSQIPADEEIVATLVVTDRLFAKQRYIQAFGESSKEAVAKCSEKAAKEGWTAPRWWQLWHRGDSIAPYPSVRC